MEFGVGVPNNKRGGGGLDTVRALHQIIVELRKALEESKSEILELKSNNKFQPQIIAEDSANLCQTSDNLSKNATSKLLLVDDNTENNEPQEDNLKERTESSSRKCEQETNIIENTPVPLKKISDSFQETPTTSPLLHSVKKTQKKVTIISPSETPKKTRHYLQTKISVTAKSNLKNPSRSLESLTVLKSPIDKNFSFTKTLSFSNLPFINREFNFTHDQTIDENATTMSVSRENSGENQSEEQLSSPQTDLDQEVDDIQLIFTTEDTKEQDFKEELVPIIDQTSDRELDDDVFETVNYQQQNSFDMKRANSIFASQSDNSINHEKNLLKRVCSYQDSSFENKSIEKDESFDRFEERIRIVETDISKCGIQEVDYLGGRRNTCPNPLQYKPLSHRDAFSKGGMNLKRCRPILTHSNAARRESGVQTEISALPGSAWLSESSLGHKAKTGENITTLPCKYRLPGTRLRLSEKTVEARRVLLSDIGFTSMVPELSRSADHLCPGSLKPPSSSGSGTAYGQFLKATDLYSPGCMSQKFTWTATTATPSESSRSPSRYSSMYPLSPPAPSRRCSAPVSPSRKALLKSTSSKVRFANGSLPDVRTEWTTLDSGDSTDSLVEEAENYLRRSIDCMITVKNSTSQEGITRRFVPRRASAPEPTRDNVPPQGWQPFLPRLSRDLKPENWVKVITAEGKVRGGRVRYVGPVATQPQEHFVGVQLSFPEGISDGTYGGRRYFQCEPYHGIFVPFKKVIMGWRP